MFDKLHISSRIPHHISEYHLFYSFRMADQPIDPLTWYNWRHGWDYPYGAYLEVQGTVVWENNELHFYPEYPLRPGTTYWVMIAPDARDNRTIGNFFVEPYVFSFTTGVPYEPDTDKDGMPDWYEYEHRWPGYHYKYDFTYREDWFDTQIEGLNPFVDDANEDYDNDGATNLDEYLAGTDPGDPLDYPIGQNDIEVEIEYLTDKVVISWNTEVSSDSAYTQKYQVWYRDDMTSGDWQKLGSPFEATGGWLQIEDTEPFVNPAIKTRFYRIESYLE